MSNLCTYFWFVFFAPQDPLGAALQSYHTLLICPEKLIPASSVVKSAPLTFNSARTAQHALGLLPLDKIIMTEGKHFVSEIP